MFDDPRDDTPVDEKDVLTEDSDDALADLEKEYAVRKQKLMEERERKRELSRTSPEVQRSPSPKRVKKEIFGQVKKEKIFSAPTRPVKKEAVPTKTPFKAIQRVASASDEFTARLGNEKASRVKYNDRIFEFENVPSAETVTLNEENEKDWTSGVVLRRRNLEKSTVTRILSSVKVLRIPKLLARIYPPHFEEPPYTNWCFAGIIMHKNDPKTAANGKKFLTLRVGDFNHTVDVFLFGGAFQRYWKLNCGGVIAILNPTIKKFGSGFSLSLQDDIESILEIGSSKYYGHCSATNKKGEGCKYVINLSKNDLCAFHEENKYKKASRMEFQGSVKPKAPTNKHGQTSQAFVDGSTQKPLFIQYANTGFQEKDSVYKGGEQFNEAKYDRPVKESTVAKMRKRKANESLRLQLMNNAPPSRLDDLDKLGIVHQNKSEIIERQNALQKIKSQAFKNKFLTGMGYDPTLEKTQRLEKAQPTRSMEELRSISKSKKVSLKPSEDEQMKKMQRQKTAMRIIKQGDDTAMRSANLSVRNQGSLLEKGPSGFSAGSYGEDMARACEKGSTVESADSDSDLEIDFACDADESRYKNVITKSGANVSGGEAVRNSTNLSREAQL